MDCNLKQWRDQHQSEIPTSAKIPRLLLEPTHHHQPPPPSLSEFALPLFVSEPNTRFSNLSAFPDSTNITNSFPRMGCPFTSVQWQELELQALIFKYMIAGADVPAELLQRIKKSFLNTPACYVHYPYQQYHPYQPTMLQSGCWGRSAVDPEPGRCRRTDGKKWRCSRDVVVGQKYCERHVHRGRSRSRKPVEIPTLGEGGLNTANPVAALPLTAVSGGTHFPLSGLSPSIDLLQLNQRSLESKTRNGGLFETHNDKASIEGRSESQLLRHFFDDCPTSHHKSNGVGGNATHLSISMPGNPSSDFSLKLSTGGNGDEPESREGNIGRERPQQNWGTHHVSSMGGPLAEVLRSSTSNSPTSVLHEIRLGSVSETISVSI